MPAIEAILDVPGIHDSLVRFEAGLAQVDPTVLPEDPHSLSHFMHECMLALEEVVDGHNLSQRHDIHLEDIEGPHGLKAQAEDNFSDVKTKIVEANTAFVKSGGDIPEDAVLNILIDYAAGYHAYTQLCTDGEPATVAKQWNEANQGDKVNCPQQVTSQEDIEFILQTSFTPSTGEGTATKRPFLSGSHWRFGPFGLYQRDPSRTYAGAGVYAEGLVPIRKNSPWVVGGIVQGFWRNSYDAEPGSPFKGELKTTEWSFVPPVLEAGYDGKSFDALALAGAWITIPLIPESEAENMPYSKIFFENPNYLLGGKLTILDRVGVSVAYVQSPWGSGYVTQAMVDLNFWRDE